MGPITLLTGRAAPLGDQGQLSGIVKTPVLGALPLGPEGFLGDEQADRRVHGGPEKAVHYYPQEHYPLWRQDLGDLPVLEAWGAFGENISARGLTEADVSVGDIFTLGSALVQVSQGRQPCWKLNKRFDQPDMARRVQGTGRTGWYFRVLQAGQVAPGDQLKLIDRIAPEWTLQRIWHVLYIDRMNLSELSAIAKLDVLADGWRRHAARRVESGMVEDWTKRLEGSA